MQHDDNRPGWHRVFYDGYGPPTSLRINSATTLNYVHVDDEKKRAAAERLSEIVRKRD